MNSRSDWALPPNVDAAKAAPAMCGAPVQRFESDRRQRSRDCGLTDSTCQLHHRKQGMELFISLAGILILVAATAWWMSR